MGSLDDFIRLTGFSSGWIVPFGFEEDLVDSLGILLFETEKEPDPEEYNLLVFLSYYYSLVYQKTEFKKNSKHCRIRILSARPIVKH